MVLSRRWSLFLLVFTVFSWIIWITFIRNIAKDDRSFHHGTPQPFFIVHMVLTVLSLAFSTVIGWLGLRGFRASAEATS